MPKNINIQPLAVDFFKNKEVNDVLRSHLLTAAAMMFQS